MTKSLQGRVALITGGASGIGRATALVFTRAGAEVSIADLNETAGEALLQEIREKGGKAVFETADVSRVADCKSVVDRVLREFGGINILFNNFGIIRLDSVTAIRLKDRIRVKHVVIKII